MAGFLTLAKSPYEIAQEAVVKYARRQAGRLEADAIPPQPTANVEQQWFGARDKDHGSQLINRGMDRVWNWAQVYAPRSGDGFLVQNVKTGHGPDAALTAPEASMHRITPEQYLAAYGYGDDVWPEVKAGMEAVGHSAPVNYRGAANLQEHLQTPVNTFVASSPTALSHFGSGRNIMVNLKQAKSLGISPSSVMAHEFGHAIAPMEPSLMRGGTGGLNQDFLKELLLKEFPELGPHPRMLDAGARRLRYRSQGIELPAIANHARRLHYGVTGDPLLKPEDRLRFIKQIIDGKKGDLGTPSMKPDAWFPNDPVMRYGPKAGKPAEEYENMRQYLRMILPNLSPQQKQDFFKTFNQGASTENHNEAVYV